MKTISTPNFVLRIWPETRAKLDAIRERQGWTISQAIDRLCDHYDNNHTSQPARVRITKTRPARNGQNATR